MTNKLEWVSVKDRLPEIKGRYLCYSPSWKRNIQVINFDEYTKGSRKRFWLGGRESLTITHWQKLPEFPDDN